MGASGTSGGRHLPLRETGPALAGPGRTRRLSRPLPAPKSRRSLPEPGGLAPPSLTARPFSSSLQPLASRRGPSPCPPLRGCSGGGGSPEGAPGREAGTGVLAEPQELTVGTVWEAVVGIRGGRVSVGWSREGLLQGSGLGGGTLLGQLIAQTEMDQNLPHSAAGVET